jgi:hypothetical protein
MKNATKNAPNAAPAMPKATRKAAPLTGTTDLPKAEKPKSLAPAQVAAEACMIEAARAADAGMRVACEAIAECAALGVHRAKGLTLPEYVGTTLLAAGIARSTVYFLKDVGTATHALGKDAAAVLPMDGLREMASAAKGDANVIRTFAAKIVPTGKAGKVTADDVRKVTRAGAVSGDTGNVDQYASILARKAVKYAGGKGHEAAAIRLLEAAAARLNRIMAKAAEVERKGKAAK